MKYNFKKTTVLSISALLLIAGCGQNLGNSSASGAPYMQVERLARPAINEGLVLSNDNLNAFNSITPSSDLEASNPAVALVLTEAQVVLDVVRKLGNTLTSSTSAPAVATSVGQFLPDVMRISVDDTHFGTLHPLVANISRTGNSNLNNVAYTSCVSLTPGAPLLCGGRKIRDDVIDITLSYLAAGAGAAAPGAVGSVPGYAVSDNITYATSHSAPLLGAFPFLAAPL